MNELLTDFTKLNIMQVGVDMNTVGTDDVLDSRLHDHDIYIMQNQYTGSADIVDTGSVADIVDTGSVADIVDTGSVADIVDTDMEIIDVRVKLLCLLPSEVSEYCYKTYFIDEDFIFQTLVLPDSIVNIAQHDGTKTYLEYLDTLTLQPENVNIQDNSEVIRQILSIYTLIYEFYAARDFHDINPDSAEFWPVDFIEEVYTICKIVLSQCCLDVKNMDIYGESNLHSRIISYGISLIITQIEYIYVYYRDMQQTTVDMNLRSEIDGCLLQMNDLSLHHYDRFIRLANNLCVLMMYISFVDL